MDIDVAAGTITFRVLYAGPESASKAVSLRGLHAQAREDERGELTVLHAGPDRIFSFPYRPRDQAELSGFRVVFQPMTMPGRLENRATERLLVAAADAVIFVPDRAHPLGPETRRAYATVVKTLEASSAGRPPVPLVLQRYAELLTGSDAAPLADARPAGLVEVDIGQDTIESVQRVFRAAADAVVERWRQVEEREGAGAARRLANPRVRLPFTSSEGTPFSMARQRRRIDARWLAVAALGAASGVALALLLATR